MNFIARDLHDWLMVTRPLYNLLRHQEGMIRRIAFLILISLWTVTAVRCGGNAVGSEDANSTLGTWSAGVAVGQTDGQTIGSTLYASSTHLAVSWTAPDGSAIDRARGAHRARRARVRWTASEGRAIDHYEVTATEPAQSTSVTVSATGSSTTATLTALRAGTSYTVDLVACLDAACQQSLAAESTATGSTPEEYWQIQGTGASYSDATKVVSEGQTLAYALRYGTDAPEELAGQVRLFYSPSPGSTFGRGLRVATNSSMSMDTLSLSQFNPISSGMSDACETTVDPESCPAGIIGLFTFQPVPLASPALIRVFIEGGTIVSGKITTRLYSFDVQDGYFAEDFHPDSDKTICGGAGSTDITLTGACAPTLEIGIDSDGGGSGLSMVRQAKIGYPKQDSWKWDMATGTFIIMTAVDTCGTTQDGLFYATWDDASWQVKKDSSGCAQALVLKAHGPVIVHLGGEHYKVYYEEVATETHLDKTKPFKVLYADGSVSGLSDVVDFEDWEAEANARDVHFLWPDGTLLAAGSESGLGDHFILLPNADSETQLMYMNLGGKDDDTPTEAATGIGMAVLVNP